MVILGWDFRVRLTQTVFLTILAEYFRKVYRLQGQTRINIHLLFDKAMFNWIDVKRHRLSVPIMRQSSNRPCLIDLLVVIKS